MTNTSTTVVEVSKNQNESAVNLIRRFTKKVQESGVLNRARATRYNNRPASKLARKNSTLRNIKRRLEIERLKKLGKIPDRPVKSSRRR